MHEEIFVVDFLGIFFCPQVELLEELLVVDYFWMCRFLDYFKILYL